MSTSWVMTRVATVDALLTVDRCESDRVGHAGDALARFREPWLGAGLVAESSAYSVLQAGPEFARWLAARPRRERRPKTDAPVLVHRAGDRLELTLNRPHVRNALDRRMRDALLEALTVPMSDPSVTDVHMRVRARVLQWW